MEKTSLNCVLIIIIDRYAAQANGRGSLGGVCVGGPFAVRGARALARAAPHVVCRELPAEGGGSGRTRDGNGDGDGDGRTERPQRCSAAKWTTASGC